MNKSKLIRLCSIFLILSFFCVSNCFAANTSGNTAARTTQNTTQTTRTTNTQNTTNTVSNNNTNTAANSISANSATNTTQIQETTATPESTNSSVNVTTLDNIPDAKLGLTNILSILLIAVGVVIIFLSIAIFIRLK